MSCLVWNCRGLGKPRAIRALKDLIRSHNPTLVFLCETKMALANMNRLKFTLGIKNCFGVDRMGLGGGLLLLWNEDWDVTLQSFSAGHIDVLVKIPRGDSHLMFFFTGFYGNPTTVLRRESWKLLQRIGHARDLAWLIAGDFNEVMYQSELVGQNQRNATQIRDFRAALYNVGLFDLGFEGNMITWRNG